MAISKKSYIDLLGLTEFRDLLLKTTIDVDNDTSVDNKTASVSAILEYVSSVETGIINGVNTSLNSKVQSVGYAFKKFTYTTGNGTTDIVDISTLKTDIGAMTGATSSNAGAMGLVPAPAKGKQASFLRGDGTWVVPTDTNTTYTVASGDSNGQIKVTPSSGSAYNVSVKGLGSAAFTESSAYAPASHNHDASYYTKTEVDTKLGGKSNTGHTHTMANITDLGVFGKSGSTASVGLVPKPSTTAGTTKFLREDGTWVVPTDNNTTYTFATGTTKGAFSVTPSGGTAKSVSIYGLGSSAYTESSAYASASHNHDDSYYTKTEVDTKLGGKSDTGHTHTIANITDLGTATSDTLGLVKSSPIGTDGKDYAVGVNSDGTMQVNIPWTDTKVTQTPSTSKSSYPILASATAGASTEGTTTSVFATGIKITPSTNTITATTFDGTATNLNYFKNTSTTNIGIDSTDTNGIGYVSGTGSILSQSDGALYRQVYSSAWMHEIYGDYRTGQIAVRGKNNNTLQAWRIVLDSSNYKTYCTPANIGASPSGHTHNYAGSSEAGGPANDFVASKASDDEDRYIYFAYNDSTYNNSDVTKIAKGRAVVDTEFKYNPSTNKLSVGKMQLESKVTLQYNSTTESLDFVFA